MRTWGHVNNNYNIIKEPTKQKNHRQGWEEKKKKKKKKKH